MPTKNTTLRFSAEEKQNIVAALKRLAVAQAEFWDTLREVEREHDDAEIDVDHDLAPELASDCDIPPQCSDLSTEDVWDAFERHVSIK